MRINERIRVPEVRLIDQDNNQVGVVRTVEALAMAREAGIDLVEVAATSKPPVCRLMDFGKWKYDQKKKEHKAKVKQHNVTLKEVRLRHKIDQHDLETKINSARKFLEKGNKVQFTMMFRGREMMHIDIANEQFASIAETLKDISKVDSPPKRFGKRMSMVMSPVARNAEVKKKPASAPVVAEKPAIASSEEASQSQVAQQ